MPPPPLSQPPPQPPLPTTFPTTSNTDLKVLDATLEAVEVVVPPAVQQSSTNNCIPTHVGARKGTVAARCRVRCQRLSSPHAVPALRTYPDAQAPLPTPPYIPHHTPRLTSHLISRKPSPSLPSTPAVAPLSVPPPPSPRSPPQPPSPGGLDVQYVVRQPPQAAHEALEGLLDVGDGLAHLGAIRAAKHGQLGARRKLQLGLANLAGAGRRRGEGRVPGGARVGRGGGAGKEEGVGGAGRGGRSRVRGLRDRWRGGRGRWDGQQNMPADVRRQQARR